MRPSQVDAGHSSRLVTDRYIEFNLRECHGSGEQKHLINDNTIPSMWSAFGGLKKCQKINRELARYVDVMIGNEGHFAACLGLDGVDERLTELEGGAFENMAEQALEEFPNFRVLAATMRKEKSATVNDWGARCWMDGAKPRWLRSKRLRNWLSMAMRVSNPKRGI